MIEICVRLGLALLLSLSLALLMAWGWDHSDPAPHGDRTLVEPLPIRLIAKKSG